MSNSVVARSRVGPIIVNKNDIYVGQGIIQQGVWSENDLFLINQTLQEVSLTTEDLVFYDVGAHVGMHTISVAKYFGARVKVRAFEAQLEMFQMLCGSIALNGLRNVRCHLNAVAEHTGETISLRLPNYGTQNNFAGLELMPPARSDNDTMVWSDDTQPVTTIALDAFDEPVSFIKMDIEGMESLALRGARSTIEKRRPIVFCELLKSNEDEIFSFFKAFGYAAYRFKDDGLFTPSRLDVAKSWTEQIF